jgi:amino acid adenylation domain-containing protein
MSTKWTVTRTEIEEFALIGGDDRASLAPDVVDAYPLGRVQEELLDDADARTGAVVAGRRVTDAVPFSPERLNHAVAAVVRRYEVLRTSIDPDAGIEPLARAHAAAEVPVAVHDLRGLDPDDRAGRLRDVVAEQRSTSFDLVTPPLARLAVVRESEREWVLLVAADRLLAEVVDLDAVLAVVLRRYRQEPAEPTAEPTVDPTDPVLRHGPCVAAELDARFDSAGEEFWRDALGSGAGFTFPGAWAGGDDSDEGTYYDLSLEYADLAEGLGTLAAEAGATLPAVLLAAHLTVLRTLGAEPAAHTDVALTGMTSTMDDDADGRVGCADLLHRDVLPFPIRPASTWRRLVRAVWRGQRDAWTHRRLPEEALARLGGDIPWSRRHRDHALFEAVDRREPGEGHDTRFSHVPAIIDANGSGYGLRVRECDGLLRLRCAAGVIAPAHGERLRQMYRLVLEAMAADPDGDARAAYLPRDERVRVLSTWSDGPAMARGRQSVVDLFTARVANTPDAVAVRTAHGGLSYREVDERSTQLAHYLLKLGAQPDTLVGVSLRRTLDLVPALLAAWKTGAGYLPLDPDLPPQRLRHMLEAARCSLVVSATPHLSTLAPLYDGRLVLVDEEHEAIAAQPTVPTGVAVDPAHLAYVIYTSGSTGVPKGVMIAHEGLVNYLLWTVEAYASHRPGGAAVFSSISFDLGIPNIFTPLITGESVHLLPEPFDPADLGTHLAAGGPYSFVKMTPGHLDLLTYQLTAAQAHDLAGIVIGAGDSFTAALAGRWLDLAGPGGTIVATEYGPTEITIGNSGQSIVDIPATELVPLGGPIPNTTMYVLTDRLEPVPVGVPGEVYIGGVGVARGYLGRPDLTADRFLPDPYGPPGSRLYRSGDLARWLPDGTLDFLGRIDNQVKIRGYRIELGEIQASLTRHPDVRDAVVVTREPTPGDKRLVAYVVPVAGRPLDPAALREHLVPLLPEYMIPAAFLAIDRIPLTSNGKVDTRALPALL